MVARSTVPAASPLTATGTAKREHKREAMTNHNNAVGTPALDVNAVFTALEKWINQRPGLEYGNYGAMAPYRAELRSIANDKKSALKALEEARGLDPQKPELLADAFSAFSGRLEWKTATFNASHERCASCDVIPLAVHLKTCTGGDHRIAGHLEYTTGQYWPTEYRKAAASVLERYIASWRQAENDAKPQTFAYQTMADVKDANRRIGNHWFDRSTMRFFNTKIESGLIGGKYFITSERYDDDRPRLFTVRRADPDGTIDTVGEFQGYHSREDAREAIREAMKGDK
jgi:hypothetical protein